MPAGRRYYVIGDIHGRADLLRRLHGQIKADAAASDERRQNTIVYLGDYIDRGSDSRGVINLILSEPLEGFERVHLKGNHEDALLRFLEDESRGAGWLAIGGQATLLSYGVKFPRDLSREEELQHIWLDLRLRMPLEHLEFLSNLTLKHEAGDYLFVHAGVRPGLPISQQAPRDLMWIRDDFLKSRQHHGKIVVHGHSARERPDIQDNRIGIDTTAYATNVLTCLVLEGTGRRFLSTAP
ncbi:MAG: metallophosphoesterase family protein [Kiloniellales bacterium]